MAFLQKKVKNGHDYWYVMEAARVNGQPRIVRQRYLGTVEAIEAAFDAAFEPESPADRSFSSGMTPASDCGVALTITMKRIVVSPR